MAKWPVPSIVDAGRGGTVREGFDYRRTGEGDPPADGPTADKGHLTDLGA